MKFELTKGKQALPVRALIYGPEGIGKTTFAAHFLGQYGGALIDTESGSARLDVLRYPIPQTWGDLLNMCRDAKDNPDVHALGIDTMDAAEKLCARYLCNQKGWDSLESPGYGAGYKRLWEEFTTLMTTLDAVVNAGKPVILTAHACMRKFELPDQMGSYDRWELKLQNSQKCSVSALVKEWADLVLFANYETIVVTAPDGKTKKAAGGKRNVYTTHHPCWDAKNRFSLPDTIPLDFAALAPYIVTTPAESPQKAPEAPASAPVAQNPAPAQTPAEAPKKASTSARKKASPAPASAPAQKSIADVVEEAEASNKEPDAPYTVKAEDLEGIPAPLNQLMLDSQIMPIEIQAWTAKEGYYPPNTDMRKYDPEYLKEYLPSVWETRIVPECTQAREEIPF